MIKIALLVLHFIYSASPQQCGNVVDPRFNNFRVSGGYKLPDDSHWPWLVEIQTYDAQGEGIQCAASIISKNYLLTAGHCVVGPKLVYKAGSANLFNVMNIVHDSVEMFRHSGYLQVNVGDDFGVKNDIAIIKLPAPLELSNVIQPICLSKVPGNFAHALISGWGRTISSKKPCRNRIIRVRLNALQEQDDPIKPNRLSEGIVRIVPLDTCKKMEYFPLRSVLDENMICAMGPRANIETGDSGSPLMVFKDDKFVQIGITSWSSYCDKNGFQSPDVFMSVSTYCAWIAETTKDEVRCSD